MTVDQPIPYSKEIEENIVGCMLIEEQALNDVKDFIKPEYFYDPANAIIVKAMLELAEVRATVNMITVVQKLKEMNKLEEAGGPFHVSEVANRIGGTASVKEHAAILIQYYLRRRIVDVSGKAFKDAHMLHEDVFDISIDLDVLSDTVKELVSVHKESNNNDAKEEAKEEIREAMLTKDGITGINTGFTDVNTYTGGWRHSKLYILAARPGMGKTSFVLECARKSAFEHGKPVGFFSLEMSSAELYNRLASSVTGIDLDAILKGRLTDNQAVSIFEALDSFDDSLVVDDTAGLSINELRMRARNMKVKYDIQMVIVDYLQLMKAPGNSENEIVTNISKGLKEISKELKVPVIALSQLSRAVENRDDKTPKLSDLRSSGSIEQDADAVMFLYRPDYYGVTQDEYGNDLRGIAKLIFAKNRSGALGDVNLRFIATQTKFVDVNEETQATTGEGDDYGF